MLRKVYLSSANLDFQGGAIVIYPCLTLVKQIKDQLVRFFRKGYPQYHRPFGVFCLKLITKRMIQVTLHFIQQSFLCFGGAVNKTDAYLNH